MFDKFVTGFTWWAGICVLVASIALPFDNAFAQCCGYPGPGGACYPGPGGGLYSGPGGGKYTGPGDGWYTGPDGGLYTGPGGGMYPGPGGGLYPGPGGGLYPGPSGGIYPGPSDPNDRNAYHGPWSPCITGVLFGQSRYRMPAKSGHAALSGRPCRETFSGQLIGGAAKKKGAASGASFV
jgi:hypothetical protein